MKRLVLSSRIAPLYAAGFTTAVGAHSIAAGLGAEHYSMATSLLTLGVLLAVYDVAEVVLKPIFGTLSDRIGAKPVILGGLLAFSAFSLMGIFASSSVALGLVRLGQGAAASAFSPASSAAVARLATGNQTGRYFGRYGSWKTLGYVLGPILGAGLIWWGGFPALFTCLTIISAAAAAWVMASMPNLPILPRPRYTLKDLAVQSVEPSFIVPTIALACATGALGTAIGFLPVIGTSLTLSSAQSMAVVSLLALASAVIQPWIGKLRDRGGVSTRRGISTGLVMIALGLVLVAAWPQVATLVVSAILIGLGVGITTPLGFAHLAATIPAERMGRTMGSAELGREAGDAGGPLIVGGIATIASVAVGFASLALILLVCTVVCVSLLRTPAKS